MERFVEQVAQCVCVGRCHTTVVPRSGVNARLKSWRERERERKRHRRRKGDRE